jgi:hypothetical protein
MLKNSDARPQTKNSRYGLAPNVCTGVRCQIREYLPVHTAMDAGPTVLKLAPFQDCGIDLLP